MGSFSNYLENKILDHLFGKASFTQPTVYVALSTADPGEDGSGMAEPSGNNYSRVSASGSSWSSASTGQTSNSQAITFPQASGSWGTITHFALFDADSSGNLLLSGALTTAKDIGAGDTPSFGAGDLVVTLD